MTELSRAAQAVLTAAKDAYWSTEEMCPNDAEVIAAAALRAAAIYSCCPVDRRILMTIADELEGQGQLTKESD